MYNWRPRQEIHEETPMKDAHFTRRIVQKSSERFESRR